MVELAAGLPISRPAVSQHLRRLKDAGLERLRTYVDGLWDEALASFGKTARKEGSSHE